MLYSKRKSWLVGYWGGHLLLPVGAILPTSSFMSARRVFSSFTANTGAHNAALSPLITGVRRAVSGQSTLQV